MRAGDDVRRGIGAAISTRLDKSGLARSQLADAAEIDDRQMKRVIEGRSGLSIYSLGRIAEALGCHPADLLREGIPPRRGRAA